MVKVQSYSHLVSYMGRGEDVRYFFNASTCVTSAKASQSSDEIPVIGGELKLFIGSKDPDDAHLFFSQVRYVDNNPNSRPFFCMRQKLCNIRGGMTTARLELGPFSLKINALPRELEV